MKEIYQGNTLKLIVQPECDDPFLIFHFFSPLTVMKLRENYGSTHTSTSRLKNMEEIPLSMMIRGNHCLRPYTKNDALKNKKA